MDFNYFFFHFLVFLNFLIYFLLFLGIFQHKKYIEYNTYIQTFIQVYVSLYLLIRFRPFHEVKFTHTDKSIAFNAGILLLTSSFLNYYLSQYAAAFKKFFHLP